jgi:hypothetical protein
MVSRAEKVRREGPRGAAQQRAERAAEQAFVALPERGMSAGEIAAGIATGDSAVNYRRHIARRR